MQVTKETNYRLTEIEAESKDYDEAMAYAKELMNKGYVADFYRGSKKDDPETTVYFVTAFKKIPIA